MRNPYSSFSSFWAVFLRECHRMTSRPIYFYCIIVAPLICLFFFTSLMEAGLPSKMPVGVVDLDHSSNSRQIMRTLNSMQQVEVVKVYGSYSEARDAVQRGKIYGFLYIPSKFSSDLQSFRRPKLTYYTSYVYYVPGSLTYSNMRKLTELVSGAAARSQLYARGATEKQAMAFLQPIVIESHAINNPSLNYSVYLTTALLPGVLMLLISLMSVYAIGSEVKYNTARYWLERGNHSILLSLTAKLLPYTIAFFIIGLFCDIYLFGVLQFPNNGGWPMLLLLTLCMVLSAQALGIVFFSLLPTLRLALCMSCLWGVVSFSACGMSFPYAAMSGPVQALSHLFPLRYYYLVYVFQVLDGNSFAYCWEGYLGFSLFILLPFLLMIRLKREIIHSFYIP
jgi:ABC-2 type transport system permease protein